jgi:hypothetical protein
VLLLGGEPSQIRAAIAAELAVLLTDGSNSAIAVGAATNSAPFKEPWPLEPAVTSKPTTSDESARLGLLYVIYPLFLFRPSSLCSSL